VTKEHQNLPFINQGYYPKQLTHNHEQKNKLPQG